MTLTKEQKEIRSRGVGSSEIAAIAGLNPWRRPIDVWREKTGRAGDQEETPATRAGHALEPVIAGWYADERHVRLVPGQTLIRDGWMVATPDYLTLPHVDQLAAPPHDGILEVKNVGARMALSWPDEGLPEYVLVQVLWQQHVVGLELADVAVFLGGNEFRIERVDPMPEILEDLADVAHTFWFKYVLRDVEPPPDASDSWKEYIAQKWPNALKPIALAPAGADAIAARLHDAMIREKAAKADRAKAESELKALIGDQRGIAGKTWAATWTDVSATQIAAFERSAYRLFKFNPAWRPSGR